MFFELIGRNIIPIMEGIILDYKNVRVGKSVKFWDNLLKKNLVTKVIRKEEYFDDYGNLLDQIVFIKDPRESGNYSAIDAKHLLPYSKERSPNCWGKGCKMKLDSTTMTICEKCNGIICPNCTRCMCEHKL